MLNPCHLVVQPDVCPVPYAVGSAGRDLTFGTIGLRRKPHSWPVHREIGSVAQLDKMKYPRRQM
jgi:hypothetical protein